MTIPWRSASRIAGARRSSHSISAGTLARHNARIVAPDPSSSSSVEKLAQTHELGVVVGVDRDPNAAKQVAVLGKRIAVI